MLQDAADLPVHRRRINTRLRTSQPRCQAPERFFDTLAELVMHGALFAAPVGRAAQDHLLVGLGVARQLDLDAFVDCAPAEWHCRTADRIDPAIWARPV